MWIVVLLSSLCSLSRFKFGLLYTIWRALVVVFFKTEYPDKVIIVAERQEKLVI